MADRARPQPTPTELKILEVLWARGPSTVRQVQEALHDDKPVGYTSVLKLLQIMTGKGTVKRSALERAHVYEAAQPAEKTKRLLVGDLIQRAFGGSASQLIMHALSGKPSTADEIAEIRRILNAHERNAK